MQFIDLSFGIKLFQGSKLRGIESTIPKNKTSAPIEAWKCNFPTFLL